MTQHDLAGEGIDWPRLREVAASAAALAYAPYSNFPVGAAALVDDGRVISGCNVENASYGLTLCAECGMVSALHAGGGGRLVAVACVDRVGRPLMPCGRCRQLLWEHAAPGCLFDTAEGPLRLDELLPKAFDDSDLAAARREPSPSLAPTRGEPASLAPPAALASHVGSGTVFVHPDALGGRQVWTAYWERSGGRSTDAAGILEEGPTWQEAATAVRWGRARSQRVVVVDANGVAAWAGAAPRPGEIGCDWEEERA